MSIQEISSNFKRLLRESDTLAAGLLILVGLGSFLLGKAWNEAPETHIITHEKAVLVEMDAQEEASASSEEIALPLVKNEAAVASQPIEGGYVGSKNGTKYHLPWCSGAKRILEENMVWFKTKEEAESAGYTPASNCKGL